MATSSIVSRSARVLDIVCTGETDLTLSQITKLADLPKSSVHRILSILLEERLVSFETRSQTYHPGTRLMAWAAAAFSTHDLPGKAGDIMEALHAEVKAMVMLSILDGTSVLFLKNVGGYDPYRQIPRVGEHCPVYACAAGKVLLAFVAKEQRQRILSEVEFIRFTDHTVKNRSAFEKELTSVRSSRLGVCDREDFLQYAAISVPVFGPDNQVLAALSLWNTVEKHDVEQLLTLRSALVDAAAKLSERLGHRQARST